MSKKVTVKRANSQMSVAQGTSGIVASRCEEKLDAAIYRCLHALTKRHEPTDEFKAQFCRGAFLKPNTKAFIQVLHFLFNIFDAREFRKRFYWPIYDKGAENAFRSSTVEYVNCLIERGKLVGMEKIKAHVVVLPGGAKFMKFLLCLIRFVLQEELRKAKGSIGGERISRARIAEMVASHKRWTEIGDRIHGIVLDETALLSKATRKMEDVIEAVLKSSDAAKQISFDKLMHMWYVLISTQFNELQKTQERLMAIARDFEAVIEKTDSKLKANEMSLPFTNEQLKDCLGSYNCQPGTRVGQLVQDVFDANGKLDAMQLIELFQTILPDVEHFFAGFCMKNPDIMKYEYKELSKVAMKFDDIRLQMDVLQRNLPLLDDCLLRDPVDNATSPEAAKDNFAIKNKLFCTPPIMMDFETQPDDLYSTMAGVRGSYRLALLNKEDVQAMNARMKLLSASTYQPRTLKTPQKPAKIASGQLHSLQSSPNLFAVPKPARKEKLNPLTMLNRIKAQSQKPVGEKSQSQMNAAINSTMNISTLSEMSMRPEFSSTLLGTPEKLAPVAAGRNIMGEEEKPKSSLMLQVPHHQTHQVKRMANSPNVVTSPRLMTIYVGSTTPKTVLSPKTLLGGTGTRRSAPSRSSLIDNEAVHTSPSGRLDSMVRHGELPQSCELLQTIVHMEDPSGGQGVGDKSEDKTLGLENGDQLVDLSRTLLASVPETLPDVERKTDGDQHMEPDEDNLFNVSDGVLTDFD